MNVWKMEGRGGEGSERWVHGEVKGEGEEKKERERKVRGNKREVRNKDQSTTQVKMRSGNDNKSMCGAAADRTQQLTALYFT